MKSKAKKKKPRFAGGPGVTPQEVHEMDVARGASSKSTCVDPLVHTAAREVAKDLRTLAKVFDEPGPGHAAVLRSFASRLDGGGR